MSVLRVPHASENLALPVRLMDRPPLDSPGGLAHQSRPAVVVDIALAGLFRGLELAADAPGVALAARYLLIVDDRYNAWFRQVEEAQRQNFVAGGAIALF